METQIYKRKINYILLSKTMAQVILNVKYFTFIFLKKALLGSIVEFFERDLEENVITL